MESEGTLIISIYSIDFKLLFSRFCREILFLLNIDEILFALVMIEGNSEETPMSLT